LLAFCQFLKPCREPCASHVRAMYEPCTTHNIGHVPAMSWVIRRHPVRIPCPDWALGPEHLHAFWHPTDWPKVRWVRLGRHLPWGMRLEPLRVTMLWQATKGYEKIRQGTTCHGTLWQEGPLNLKDFGHGGFTGSGRVRRESPWHPQVKGARPQPRSWRGCRRTPASPVSSRPFLYPPHLVKSISGTGF
jgi:hypothetical protein